MDVFTTGPACSVLHGVGIVPERWIGVRHNDIRLSITNRSNSTFYAKYRLPTKIIVIQISNYITIFILAAWPSGFKRGYYVN